MRTKITYLLSIAILFAMLSGQSFGQTLLDEDFNSYEGDAPDPVGWNELNGVSDLADSTSEWDVDYSTYYSDTASALATFSSWNGEPKDSWLVTPTLDLTQNGGVNRLSFYYKGNSDMLGANDSISVMISVDEGSTFELLKTIKGEIPTVWTNEIIDLSAWGSSATVKLAFYFHDDTEEDKYNKFFLDDVKVAAKPAHDFSIIPGNIDERSLTDTTIFAGESVNFHMMVENLGTTTESAPIKWTCEAGTPATNSESTSELADGETEHYQFANTWTAPNTNGTYTLKIYTDHASDEFRENDTAIVNITVYEPYQTLNEDFDDAAEWPFAWRAMPEGTNDLKVVDDDYYSNSNPNSIKFNSSAEVGYMAFTPAVESSSGKSYRLTTNISGNTGGEIIVGTISDFMDTTTFVPKDTLVVQENFTYQTDEIIFDTPGIKQFAYKYNNPGKAVYLDDISFDEVSPYAVDVELLGSAMALVEGSSGTYNVKLRNKGYNEETFDLSASGGWDYTVLDKDSETEITDITLDSDQVDTVLIQVEAPSGVTDSTSDEMTFIAESQQDGNVTDTVYTNTYAYEVFTELDEGFEEAVEIPFAWTALDPEEGNVNVYSSSFSAHNGENYVSLSNAETGTLVGLMSPAIDQANLYQLNFYHDESGTLLVGKTDNPSDLSTIDTLGEFTGGYSYSEIELTFSVDNDYAYLVFIHEVDGGYDKVNLDDISLQKMDPYAVKITDSENGTFIPAGMSASYFIEIKNAGYEDETFDLSANGSFGYSIMNKEETSEISSVTIPAQSTDSIYVQAEVPAENIQDGESDELEFVVASQNDESVTDTTFITTEAYNPITSLDEGFEASSDLPDYWSGLKFADYSDVGINTYGGYNSDHSAKVYESGSAVGHSYLISPAISKKGKRYELSFFSKCYSTGDHLMVGKMTQQGDTSSFEVIDTITVSDSYTKDSLEIELEQDAFIAFATVTSGNTVNIDSVQLHKLPAVSIYPEDGSVNIGVDSSIIMQFNVPVRNMDGSELTSENVDSLITLKEGGEEGTEVPFDATINSEKTRITVSPNSELASETLYYTALADSVIEDTNEVVVPGDQASFTTADVIPPQFVGDYPIINDTLQNAFEFTVQLNETGDVYYMLVHADADAPSVHQVMAGENYGEVDVVASNMISVDASNTDFAETISNLEINTDYVLYMVAQDKADQPNIQETVTSLQVTTLSDQTAPAFVDGYPEVSDVTESSFKLSAQLNEKGVVYFVVVEDNAAEPTSTEVKDGADYGSVTVVENGNAEVNEDSTTITIEVSGLDANTDYDIYVVAEDAAETPNLQENPVMVEVSTEGVTGIEDRVEEQVNVYPNPLKSMLKVESSRKISGIKVYDVLGNIQKEVIHVNKKYVEMNFEDMESGIYIIKITDANSNNVIKKVQKH